MIVVKLIWIHLCKGTIDRYSRAAIRCNEILFTPPRGLSEHKCPLGISFRMLYFHWHSTISCHFDLERSRHGWSLFVEPTGIQTFLDWRFELQPHCLIAKEKRDGNTMGGRLKLGWPFSHWHHPHRIRSFFVVKAETLSLIYSTVKL